MKLYKVLIIDDEPWSREVVKSLGQWESLKLAIIGEAEDGTEGLCLIRELSPDIVITDMRMPGIEGTDLLKAINDQFPHVKIIVMSGYDDFVYLKQAIRSRAMEYLLKPIDPEELNTTLMQCVQELEQAREKANPSWGSSPVFTDAAVLEKYLSYRQVVYGHLLELNKSAVKHTLADLKSFLESTLQETQNENITARVGHDFLIMLEEFMSEEDSGLKRILDQKEVEWAQAAAGSSAADAIDGICLLYEKAIDHMENMLKSKNRLDLKEVQAYIDHHFQDPISLETIARRFFVSKEHLSRIFKSFAGINVSDYIIKKRMEKAKELIAGHGLAIKNAAQMTGYEDLAYFYKLFKKYFGFTPGELRK